MFGNSRFIQALNSWWNNAVIGSDPDGTVNYIYIPSPPAMFPMAAIVPVRLEEEPAEEVAFLEGLWSQSRTV